MPKRDDSVSAHGEPVEPPSFDKLRMSGAGWRVVTTWVPVLTWMAVIFLLSSQSSFPPPPESLFDLLLRKLGHVAEYAALGALLLRALSPKNGPRARSLVWAVAIAGAYALSDEIHQSLVPLRTASLVDVAIDGAGALAGATVWQLWQGATRSGHLVSYTDE